MFKDSSTVNKTKHKRIRMRIRKKIHGTPERPRVFVLRSNRYIYAQVIDDNSHTVLTSASTLEKEFKAKNKNTHNVESSKALGKMLAKRLAAKKIKTIVFDRGLYPYHGRIKSLAEALREEGVIF
jgi:large subunit ribosomal protein L18